MELELEMIAFMSFAKIFVTVQGISGNRPAPPSPIIPLRISQKQPY